MATNQQNSLSKQSALGSASNLVLHPFTSGTAGSLLVKSGLEALLLIGLLYLISSGLSGVLAYSSCLEINGFDQFLCVLLSPAAWVWLTTVCGVIISWAFVSCLLRSESLVPLSLTNALTMCFCLLAWLLSDIYWLSWLVVEVLIFLSFFSGYRLAFSWKRPKRG